MRDLGERVGLVHELAELRGAEELAHRGRRGLGVDQVVRHHRVDVDRAHALADGALHAQQADAILVLHQLADGTNAPIAEVVDVVDRAAAILQLAQDLHRADDVLAPKRTHGVLGINAEPHVDLDASDGRKVVAVRVEEQPAEQRLGCLGRWRLTGAHDAIDVDQRVVTVGVLVHRQRVADPRPVRLVDRQRRQLGDPGLLHGGQPRLGDLFAGLGMDLAGLLVDQVERHVAAEHVGPADENFFSGLGDLLDHAGGELGVRLGDDLAALGVDHRLKQLGAAKRLRIERPRPSLGGAGEHHLAVEHRQDGLAVKPLDLHAVDALARRPLGLARSRTRVRLQSVKQRGHRQLPLAVDADVDEVLAVELEVEPRAAIRNHSCCEQELARRVRLALVVVEEHAWRAVHLADDHALGAVDHEGAVIGHERHVAHVDRLLLDVADRAGTGVLVDVPHDQPQHHLERRRERHAALDALLDVVFRLLKLVIDELQPATPGEIVDRENGLEDLLQPGRRAAVRRDVHLQERLVGGALHVDQVGHGRHFGYASEALANTLAPCERLGDSVHRASAAPSYRSPSRSSRQGRHPSSRPRRRRSSRATHLGAAITADRHPLVAQTLRSLQSS